MYLCRGTAIRTAVCSSGLLKCTQRRPTHHSGITVERTSWTGRPHTMRNFQGVGSSPHLLSPGTFIRLVTESIPRPRKFPKGMRIVGPASSNRERLAGKQSSPSSHYGRVHPQSPLVFKCIPLVVPHASRFCTVLRASGLFKIPWCSFELWNFLWLL